MRIHHKKIALMTVLALALTQVALGEPTRHELKIGQQSLATALKELAAQTGLQVVVMSQDAGGKQSRAVEGSFTNEEALAKLLEDTGLTYQKIDEGTVAIKPLAWLTATAGAEMGVRLAQTETAGSVEAGKGEAKDSSETAKLEEVVVTAQKRKEILKDVPISISVLSGENLDKSTFTGVMESLRTVPGVSTQPGGGIAGGTAIQIRGVAGGPIFVGSTPVGYYLDGVPFSLIRDAITPDQNAFDLERIEVLRGPQGTLYGASAESGLVRVLTRNADLNRFEFKARSTLSQTDGAEGVNYRGDVALNVPLVEGKLAARAVVGYDGASGWIHTPVKNGSNSARTRTYRLKINAQPTDRLSVGLSSWINRENQDAGAFSDDNFRRGAIEPEPFAENYEVHNLQVAYEFPAFTLTSSSGYLDYKGIGTIDYTRYFLVPGMTTSIVDSKIPSRSVSEEVALNSVPSSAWKWTAGALYRDIRGGLTQVWPGILTQPISFVDKSKSSAIFGQIGHRFAGERFEWTLGLRHFKDTVSQREDDVSIDPATGIRYFVEKHYSANTPRAVLTWYPSKTATMYASYAQGFRSGLPLNYNVGLVYPGLPGARPDRLNNYEIGAKFDLLDRRLSFDVAAYYMKWNDIIEGFPVPYQNTLVAALANGTSASGAGAEFSMVARPRDGLELGLGAGWNDLTEDKDVYLDLNGTTQAFAAGDRLSGSPELTSFAFVRLQRPLGARGYRGALSVSASYTSKLQTFQPGVGQRTVSSGDDMVFGQASISVEAPSGWSAALFVDNFNNERGKYLPSPAYYADDYLSHYRPRTVGVQFEYRYGR